MADILERLSAMALNMEDMCSDLQLERDDCDDIIESIKTLVFDIQTVLDEGE